MKNLKWGRNSLMRPWCAIFVMCRKKWLSKCRVLAWRQKWNCRLFYEYYDFIFSENLFVCGMCGRKYVLSLRELFFFFLSIYAPISLQPKWSFYTDYYIVLYNYLQRNSIELSSFVIIITMNEWKTFFCDCPMVF